MLHTIRPTGLVQAYVSAVVAQQSITKLELLAASGSSTNANGFRQLHDNIGDGMLPYFILFWEDENEVVL